MSLELTSAEKVIWKASYNFAKNTLKVSDDEAKIEADNKIIRTRKLRNVKGIIRK